MAFEKRNFIFAIAIVMASTLLTGWFAAKAHSYFTTEPEPWRVVNVLGPCKWERRFVIPCTDCATHGPQLGSVQ
jgi:hypothetical protein